MRRRPARPKAPLIDCRDCCDPIMFVHLPSGKQIPVNPGPSQAGTVCARLIGGALHGYVISVDRPARVDHIRFRPHAATCEARDRRPTPEPDPSLF